ncbi:MAG TPA: hypothetical protein QGF35_04045 [Dehalococcoidia bacterium]|nr:hypothetical protein [Dehalococcoidia bacterium]
MQEPRWADPTQEIHVQLDRGIPSLLSRRSRGNEAVNVTFRQPKAAGAATILLQFGLMVLIVSGCGDDTADHLAPTATPLAEAPSACAMVAQADIDGPDLLTLPLAACVDFELIYRTFSGPDTTETLHLAWFEVTADVVVTAPLEGTFRTLESHPVLGEAYAIAGTGVVVVIRSIGGVAITRDGETVARGQELVRLPAEWPLNLQEGGGGFTLELVLTDDPGAYLDLLGPAQRESVEISSAADRFLAGGDWRYFSPSD